MTRTDALILRTAAAWTIYIWVTRIWNIVRDEEHGFAFKAVHSVLALVSIAFAVAAWSIVSRNRKRDGVDIPS